MGYTFWSISLTIYLSLSMVVPARAQTPARPNVLVVLTDDVGWGDFACYNPHSKIPAPHVERLAREGMRFANAHTPAALCSPTRYSILTGNYPWRGRSPNGTWGFNVPSQILPGQKTVAHMLKQAGYRTAMIGKQGFGGEHIQRADGSPDFTQPMVDGPLSWGFDYSAIIPRGHQAPPYLFLVNERPECDPKEIIHARFANPSGGKAARKPALPDVHFSEPNWDHSQVGKRLLDHAERFLDWHQAQNAATGSVAPFFLHFCTDGAHTPHVPPPTLAGRMLKGATHMTDHTDMVMETDILLGALMDMLAKRGWLDHTLICFTSDNGGIPTERALGHDATGGLRGRKSFVFEGGTRVPFILRWPGTIPANTLREQFVGIHDLAPTLLELAGVPMPDDQCLDAVSLVPVLTGAWDDRRPVRRHLIVDSSKGRDAMDDGETARAKGGNGQRSAKPNLHYTKEETAMSSHGMAHALYEDHWKLVFNIADQPAALYDLKSDPTEQNNLLDSPEQKSRVENMTRIYRVIRSSRRST